MIDDKNIEKVYVGYDEAGRGFCKECDNLREAYNYINYDWEGLKEFHHEIIIVYKYQTIVNTEELQKHFMVKELNK